MKLLSALLSAVVAALCATGAAVAPARLCEGALSQPSGRLRAGRT